MNARQLQKLRHSLDLTQSQFAGICDMNYHSLRGYEGGRPIPRTIAELIRLKTKAYLRRVDAEERRLNRAIYESMVAEDQSRATTPTTD